MHIVTIALNHFCVIFPVVPFCEKSVLTVSFRLKHCIVVVVVLLTYESIVRGAIPLVRYIGLYVVCPKDGAVA